jgi:hypothetical protein
LRIERGRDIAVAQNRLRDWALAVRIGLGDAKGGPPAGRPEAVVFERNLVESRTGGGTGIALEAGSDVRISNNVFEGLAEGFVLFGRPPQTAAVSVANNLILNLFRLAYRLEDAAAVAIFDHNIYTGARPAVSVEVGTRSIPIARALRGAGASGVFVAAGVRFLNRDLARVEGVAVVDRGRPFPNVPYEGKAPDIGVAEH